MLEAVEAVIAKWELDALGEAKAAIARSLAVKLDFARMSNAATVAIAMPGLARELRETLQSIGDDQFDGKDFVADLFAPVGNS